MDDMNRMPGGLSTPPASPGKHLSKSEPEDSQTTEAAQDATKEVAKRPETLTISTSLMNSGLASLTCATRLSPEGFSASRNSIQPNSSVELSVVLTPELLAVGELVAAMRRVVGVLGTTFESLGDQTERVASLAPALKASEQVRLAKLYTAPAQQNDLQR
jgi:hypothetical protein